MDFHDLKLFRPQEYYTDEGALDPITGGFLAFSGAVGDMLMGLVDFPSETLRALHIPSGSSRQRSQASVPTSARKGESSHIGGRSTPSTSARQSQTTLNVQESFANVGNPPNLSGLSSSILKDGSSSKSDVLQGESSLNHDDARRRPVGSRSHRESDNDYDMLRPTGAHTSKGFGRIVKAIVKAPMEISLSFTKGIHNVPKLWGDDTVRPQERVGDFKSGIQAIGKEVGFGWYDGVTGLFTQPWQGAKKEGASGFVKGIGKGIGGFVTKPGSAVFAVLGYMMKGIHKELQKSFGSNVQNHIVGSRAAQGYEEWLQSSDAEKEDVVARWKLIRKYVKKKLNPDEMLQVVLEAQKKQNLEDRGARHDWERAASSVEYASSADAYIQDPASTMLAMDGTQSPLLPATTARKEFLGADEISEITRLSIQETSCGDGEENVDPMRAIQETGSQLQRQRQEVAGHHYQAYEDNLRQAMTASEAEAQRPAGEALEYEEQLKRVMAQGLGTRRHENSDSGRKSDTGLDAEEDEEFERARRKSKDTVEKADVVASGSPAVQRPPSYDPGHLAGTMQSVFEAQQQAELGEKTRHEKTEEEIVMEYVKKQSLLERHHQNKGKGRAIATEDEDDEDLQKALKLSMQGRGYEEYRYGEASGL